MGRSVLLILALAAASCSSEEQRARAAWAPAVETNELGGLEAALRTASDLSAQVGREIADGNFGKARVAAMELERSAARLTGYYAPLLRAKEGASRAYKLLRMGEDLAAADAAEKAAIDVREAAKQAADDPRAAAMQALAADLAAVRAQLDGRRNIARYKLEEAAARLNEWLAAAPAP